MDGKKITSLSAVAIDHCGEVSTKDDYSNDYGYSGSMRYYKGQKCDSVPIDWDVFLKPLIREGATVSVFPHVTYEYNEEERDIDGKYKEFIKYDIYNPWELGKDVSLYSKGERSADFKTCTVQTTKYIKTLKIPSVKVKIPKQKNAPKVKIDAVKETISTSPKMEISFCPAEGNGAGEYSEWKDATKKMPLNTITDAAVVASGGNLRVRFKATNKAIASKYMTIEIPSRGAVDKDKVEMKGFVTNASLTISDFNSTTKPYEYTTVAPTSGTKWITLKSGTLEFKDKKAFTDGEGIKIYIREKAIKENAKKKQEAKLASSVLSIKYVKDGKDDATRWIEEVYVIK